MIDPIKDVQLNAVPKKNTSRMKEIRIEVEPIMPKMLVFFSSRMLSLSVYWNPYPVMPMSSQNIMLFPVNVNLESLFMPLTTPELIHAATEKMKTFTFGSSSLVNLTYSCQRGRPVFRHRESRR